MTIALAILLLVAELPRFHWTPDPRPSLLAADSTPSSSQVRYNSVAAARLDTATTPTPPPASVGEVLVARTWTKVHRARNKAADVEAVLLPRDSVVADSLEQGWYRVALDGTVIGYVHRSTLVHP
ncbi:MAG TPA: hypothetical protein VK688_03670 [Gemmatimonadales bacterium]|nr:hypothetical protein [Gemmatimonadales bacterium]